MRGFHKEGESEGIVTETQKDIGMQGRAEETNEGGNIKNDIQH